MSANVTQTQSKYVRVPKKDDASQIKENEIRIKGSRSDVRKYVEYSLKLLCGPTKEELEKIVDEADKETPGGPGDDKDKDKEEAGDDAKDEAKGEAKDAEKDKEEEKKADKPEAATAANKFPSKLFKTITLKASGRAINKAVTTAEIVKRNVPDLHQETRLETLDIVDTWEPTEIGLKTVQTTRRVASITITLTTDLKDAQVSEASPGYQKPLPHEMVKQFVLRDRESGRRPRQLRERQARTQPKRPRQQQGQQQGQQAQKAKGGQGQGQQGGQQGGQQQGQGQAQQGDARRRRRRGRRSAGQFGQGEFGQQQQQGQGQTQRQQRQQQGGQQQQQYPPSGGRGYYRGGGAGAGAGGGRRRMGGGGGSYGGFGGGNRGGFGGGGYSEFLNNKQW